MHVWDGIGKGRRRRENMQHKRSPTTWTEIVARLLVNRTTAISVVSVSISCLRTFSIASTHLLQVYIIDVSISHLGMRYNTNPAEEWSGVTAIDADA